MPYTQRIFLEPEGVSEMPSLRLALAGHIPRKWERITKPFPHYGLGMVGRGRGVFLNAGEQAPTVVEAPFVFYFRPDEAIFYGPKSGSDWDERFVAFDGARAKEWVRNGWWPASAGCFTLSGLGEAVQIHERLLGFMERPEPGGIDRAKLLVEELVLVLSRQRRMEQRDDAVQQGIRELLLAWRENPRQAVDLRQAATDLGISYSLFRKRFKMETGLSPYRQLLNVRIDHACNLLLRSAMPVKEISYECGFDYVESFNRCFRNIKKMAPLTYRSRLLRVGDATAPGRGKLRQGPR